MRRNIITVIAAGILVSGCASKEGTTDGGPSDQPVFTAAQRSLADIKTGTLQKRMLSAVVACSGEIEVPPQGVASVTAPLGGYIEKTDIVPGRYVRKGARLATMANPEYIVMQQSFLETSAQLKFAEQDYIRQQALDQQNATAGKLLQESESRFMVLKARLAGLRAQLQMIGIDMEALQAGDIQPVVTLRAPISGYVTVVNHHPGAYVEPREPIFEVVDLHDLHLHLNVFEQDISRISKGHAVRFRTTDGADKVFSAEVSLVSPKRNDEANAFDVHAHITTPAERLKPGMYVKAEILVSADSVSALPENAVVYRGNVPHVVIARDGSFELLAVETGVKMDGWVEIKSLDASDARKFVVSGASRVAAALDRR